jgi:hypothetical protein
MTIETPPGRPDATAGWVLRYLLDRGLITPREAVFAAPVADDISASHAAFLVRVGGSPRCFVKRANPRKSGRDLGAEPAVYRLAARHPALSALLPRCLLIDEASQTIVLDALTASPLHSLLLDSDVMSVLPEYGAAVARLHTVRPVRFGTPPWLPAALEARWGAYGWLPERCASLLARLRRSPVFCRQFAAARDDWRPIVLIHGDIRWANALAETAASPRIWLVDWELGCMGDPAWDAGSLLADAIAMAAMYPTTALTGDPFPSGAALLGGYRDAARLDAAGWQALLLRSVRFAGIRLVQAIIEYGYSAEAEMPRAEETLVPWAAQMVGDAPGVAAALTQQMEQAA